MILPILDQANIDKMKARIEQNIQTEPNTGCWLWTGASLHHGYGVTHINGRNQRAHRLSYEAYRGQIPDGLLVMHICDTPGCVNPLHLRAGTVSDNTMDAFKKGRIKPPVLCGPDRCNSKLSKDQVVAIRADSRPWRILAKEYGVTKSSIWQIKKLRSYRCYLEVAV